MNVLVTGGAGYIGSVVAERLLDGGHAVVVYDSLVTGHRDAVPAPATFVEADLIDGRRLVDTLIQSRVDAVLHMAASALVSESVDDPAKYYRWHPKRQDLAEIIRSAWRWMVSAEP